MYFKFGPNWYLCKGNRDTLQRINETGRLPITGVSDHCYTLGGYLTFNDVNGEEMIVKEDTQS